MNVNHINFEVIISFHDEYEYFEDVLIQAVSIFGSRNIRVSVDNSEDDFYCLILEKCACLCIEKIHRFEYGNFTDVLNAMIRNSNAEYLVRVDGDDILLPERKNMLKKMADGGFDFGMSDAILLYQEKDILTYKLRVFRCFPVFGTLKFGYNPIIHPSVIVKREIMLKFPYLHAERYEDLETFRQFPTRLKILNFHAPTLIYRTRSSKGLKGKGLEFKYGSVFFERFMKFLFYPKIISK